MYLGVVQMVKWVSVEFGNLTVTVSAEVPNKVAAWTLRSEMLLRRPRPGTSGRLFESPLTSNRSDL